MKGERIPKKGLQVKLNGNVQEEHQSQDGNKEMHHKERLRKMEEVEKEEGLCGYKDRRWGLVAGQNYK